MTDRDPLTLSCSVCDAEYQAYSEVQASAICSVCGWPQAADPDAVASAQDEEREAWARGVWQTLQDRQQHDDRQNDRHDEQHDPQYEYLTQGMSWLLDRLEALDLNCADRFGRIETQLDAAIAINPSTHPSTHPSANPSPQTDELPLNSDLGLDYTPLAIALSQADWRTADAITHRLIDEAIALNRPSQTKQTLPLFATHSSTVTILDDIARFPAADLQTLAWLWAAYSDGRFGWVAQISQWTDDYATFCDRVGWRTPRGWLYYDELRFEPETLESVAIGHFPVLGWRKRACYGIEGETVARILLAWFDRWRQISESSESSESSEMSHTDQSSRLNENQ